MRRRKVNRDDTRNEASPLLCSGLGSDGAFDFHCKAASKEDPSCKQGISTSSSTPWSKRTFSFATWSASLLKQVLSSRTPFAEFVKTTLHSHSMRDAATEQALFPLPVPKPGIFRHTKCGSRQRRRLSFDQAFHIIVMALNFWHADCSFVLLASMARTPTRSQAEALEYLRDVVRAFGSSGEEFRVIEGGRRLPTLVSLLDELSDIFDKECHGGDPYSRTFEGVDRDLSKAEELRPYCALDPSRLILYGSALWDPSPYLSDRLDCRPGACQPSLDTGGNRGLTRPGEGKFGSYM